MILYWILFLVPAVWALNYADPRYRAPPSSLGILWLLSLIALTLVIGLRHEIGGDWYNYLPYIELAQSLSFQEAKFGMDPGYAFLTWIGANWGGGIYFVNIVCGLLFSIGLTTFCRQLPRPWLAMAISIPYLVMIVAMGYSRQGVAIGIAMWGLVQFERRAVWRFVFSIALAGLFHKSAVILLLIAIVSGVRHKLAMLSAIIGISIGLYLVLLADAVDALITGYLDAEYQSAGAGVRVAMNALPGLLFLVFRRSFLLNQEQKTLWSLMAWASIVFIALLFVSPSTTAVDRVALYLIPLQLFVWAHFPDAIRKQASKNLPAVFFILGYYALVLFVWLFFADHRSSWVPYKFYLFELLDL